MSVYVDDMEAPFGRMIMCHMIADTHAELMEMADRIGVARKWIQEPGGPGEHFDIAKSKRAMAIELGAEAITLRQLAEMTFERAGRNLGKRWGSEEMRARYFDEGVACG